MSAILKLCDFATIELRPLRKRISETPEHCRWAAKKGHSGPSGNANAFRYGLSAIQRRRADAELTDDEQAVRASILGLIADKGGEQQIGITERILAEIISSDVSLLVTVNQV